MFVSTGRGVNGFEIERLVEEVRLARGLRGGVKL